MPDGWAHSELLETSPAANSTVGGSFDRISFFFSGIHETVDPSIVLEPPPGVEVASAPVARDGQQVVLPIDPLTVPGTYRVFWSALSGDGDGHVARGSFKFRYDPSAGEPAGLTLSSGDATRLDLVTLTLLMLAAAVSAFLVHRLWVALVAHRTSRLNSRPTTESG